MTTLYIESDYEDELRRTGFSKEGRHKNPQIILGLLVSIDGYPLAYCIHEGNKYEGHTMQPVVTEFVRRYNLEDFIVVADSGLMNNDNMAELERNGYKYIIGAKIRNESRKIKQWILEQPKVDCRMVEYDKGGGQRLLVGYTEDRARKDAYNRDKGIRRLEKAYKRGTLTKTSEATTSSSRCRVMSRSQSIMKRLRRMHAGMVSKGILQIPRYLRKKSMRHITTFGTWSGLSAYQNRR